MAALVGVVAAIVVAACSSGGGAGGSGGVGASVGASATGGGSGGASATGGGSGGASATGGTVGSGGLSASGGSTASGGTTGSTVACKRGIAANTAPGAAFSPAVSWWYNWAATGSGAGAGIEFVPMLWGSGSLSASIPAAAKFLLGFNEPNFKAQANLTAAAAASAWPTVESKAAGRPIVSPGMNYCGPAANCNGTDPYQYLKDFFAACAGCAVDFVAVHWYNCDLPSLRDYLEAGANLPGFEQFGKPIWLTEFSCDGNASLAEQEAYMRAAIPYLEGNPKVFRYAWFSADPIPNAKLINADGTPTALGRVYLELPAPCRL